ncbi:MAG: type IV secretory system conjugative DNA transfer family protein, partial [Actinomycetota bacterium]|nr:type IV secretory system conjugative DNA transfer family protein [Actinomycetota bacterium]
AALAARLTGRAGAVRFVDAGQALLGLPSHLSDPKQAWPAPVRGALPGPIAYWACQLLVLAAAAAVIAGFLVLRGRRRDRRGPLGVTPEAGFARRRHLRRLVVPDPEPGRVTIGYAGKRLLACEPQASLAVIGPSGCGKTAGFAIPALLEWKGPIIATSVKSDLIAATIAHRRSRGRVWVFDPTRVSGEDPAPWSPLDACTTWPGALRTAAWMVESVTPARDSLADADYWYTQARKGLAPHLFAAATGKRDLAAVVRWVDAQARTEPEHLLEAAAEDAAAVPSPETPEAEAAMHAEWEALYERTLAMFRRMLAAGPPVAAALADLATAAWPCELALQVADSVEAEWQADRASMAGDPTAALLSARALWDKEPRLRGSVYATIQNVLAAWADPLVGHVARPSPFRIDLDEWLAGDNTIYVVATADEQARLRPVLTVLLQQAVRHAYDTASRRGGRLERPCLALIDEAGNTVVLPDLPAYASTARSHGITLVTVWQDLGQLKAAYRERSRTVLNNHRAKLFGAGISDPDTLDLVSRLVGDTARVERNVSTDLAGNRRSVSEHATYRRAAPIDVLRRMGADEGVLVYGNELPAHVRLRPWFTTPSLRATAGRDDLIEPEGRRRARLRRGA